MDEPDQSPEFRWTQALFRFIENHERGPENIVGGVKKALSLSVGQRPRRPGRKSLETVSPENPRTLSFGYFFPSEFIDDPRRPKLEFRSGQHQNTSTDPTELALPMPLKPCQDSSQGRFSDTVRAADQKDLPFVKAKIDGSKKLPPTDLDRQAPSIQNQAVAGRMTRFFQLRRHRRARRPQASLRRLKPAVDITLQTPTRMLGQQKAASPLQV